jgi:hypothetical protein
MRVAEIEALPIVKEATAVLKGLETLGLIEPAIASGWTRGLLTDSAITDTDVAYVGKVHYGEAQEYLRAVLSELGLDPKPWDIKGIWNAQMSYGVEHTVDNYLLYYVDSIDSVYLAADGKLHDPTGHGFSDAEAKILRINEYDRQNGRKPTAYEEVNVCLEGCRRITRLCWKATPESRQRIIEGVVQWENLSDDEKAYFFRKLASKYKPEERADAQKVYYEFGWGFIFDHIDN